MTHLSSAREPDHDEDLLRPSNFFGPGLRRLILLGACMARFGVVSLWSRLRALIIFIH